MPQPPTTFMLLVLPTEGSDDDLWDQYLNEVLGGVNGVDAHDHTTGRGKQVPSAGIGINADLTFAGFRATSMTGLAFTALGTALTVGAREVFVGPDNNLYYRNALGVNVRVTNGNTLDVTSVGGIAGDYSAVGAEVAYVDASDTYTMRQQVATAVRQFARVACAGLDLFEYKAAGSTPVPVNRVRLSSPAALAASLELVMPAALPASQQILQVSPAGAVGTVIASNTIPQPVALSGGITNNVPLAAGATAAAGQTIESPTLKATAKLLFTFDITLPYPAGALVPIFSAGATPANDFMHIAMGTSTGTMTIPLPGLPPGIISKVEMEVVKSSGAGTFTAVWRSRGAGTVAPVDMGVATQGGSPGLVTLNLLPLVAPAPSDYSTSRVHYVAVQGGGTTGDTATRVLVTMSNPT